MIIVNVFTRRRFRSGAFLSSGVVPSTRIRPPCRPVLHRSAHSPRRGFRGAGPRGRTRDFFATPPSHYNPLNLPHGPHALPAADRTVPSRGPSAATGSGSPPWPWPASSADHPTDPRPDPDHRTGAALGVLFMFPWLNLGRCANLPPVPPSGSRCPALLPALSLAILPPVFHTIFTQIRIQPGKERARKRYTSGLSSWSKWRDSNPRPFGPEPVSGCSRKKQTGICIIYV